MMEMSEKNYDFRRRMGRIFKSDGRVEDLRKNDNELEISDAWEIQIEGTHNKLLGKAASDLKEFLSESMGVHLCVPGDNDRAGKIILCAGENEAARLWCNYEVSDKRIRISGANPRGLLYGVIHLEDLMFLRRAPFIKLGNSRYQPLARMRSTHSGSGLDDFPDWQLEAILHAGFTAIDVFVCGIDQTTQGHCDLNDLINRAEKHALDVVIYSYMTCYVHPEDPGADAVFDDIYGKLFRAYPKAKAIHLVGESLEFPSRDKATVKKSEVETGSNGLQDIRQPTGYYPNSDYPDYIAKIRDTVHRAAPGAEVIFNTYNWGWAPADARKKFLANFPQDVTLQVTYDIFKQNRRGDLACPVMDYSIFAEEPGFYFTSEVETAASFGIRNIRVTSNLAGTTWDFGCVPYAPVPFRWIKRMKILKKYLLEYDVNSFYDSHHYGWWPNVCNDLTKAIFSSDEPENLDIFLRSLAVRDYGENVADEVVEIWRTWSRAMDHYVASNEDQYGPWRVGPAYPFVFHPVISRTMDDKNVVFPLTERAFRASGIVKVFYHPYENNAQSPGPLRYPVEIAELEIMECEWNRGLDGLAQALDKMEPRKKEEGELLYGLGKFIRNSIRTTLGIKKWWLANMRLQVAPGREAMLEQLNIIENLLDAEAENVSDTMPCVERDSRLGWEPRMDYVCDREHLEWKLRQLAITKEEIVSYRKLILL